MFRQLVSCSTVVSAVALAGCGAGEPDSDAVAATPTAAAASVTLGGSDAAPEWSACIRPGGALLIRGVHVQGGSVTFGQPSFDSNGAALGAEVTYAPVKAPIDGYLLAGENPGDPKVEQEVDWARRRPLVGAELPEGDYALFVATRGREGTELRDGSFPWTSDGSSGTANTPWNVRFRADC